MAEEPAGIVSICDGRAPGCRDRCISTRRTASVRMGISMHRVGPMPLIVRGLLTSPSRTSHESRRRVARR